MTKELTTGFDYESVDKAKPPSKNTELWAESTELMREVVETAKATAQRTGQPVVSRIASKQAEEKVDGTT